MNDLIDAGDPRTKVVGRRYRVLSNEEKFHLAQSQFTDLWPTLPFPKGVHRFKTEEEAHQWKETRMIQRSLDRRNAQTSSEPAGS
jgi:hypothetical protein